MKMKATILALGFCLAAWGAQAQRMDEPGERRIHITQGPSIINDMGYEATLTWTTDRPAANNVRYRVGDGAWQPVSEPGGTTSHALRLTGLQPGRNVEWQILTHDGDVRTSGSFRPRGEEVREGPPGRGYGYGRRVPIYRADNTQTGQHLYTSDRHEIAKIERQGWRSVGTVGYVATSETRGHIPLFRVYVQNGDHFYTTSPEERDTVLSQGGRDEGVVGYIAREPRPGTLPLHRMVSTRTGMHFYSANAREVAEAVRHQGYRDEGVMGYVWLE